MKHVQVFVTLEIPFACDVEGKSGDGINEPREGPCMTDSEPELEPIGHQSISRRL